MLKMKEKMDITAIKDRRVVVVGLQRSGLGAANLLSYLGAKVSVTDRKPSNSLVSYIQRLDKSIRIITNGHPDHLFYEADLVVVSPGVPLNIPPLVNAHMRGIPVIGELELAYQVVTSGMLRSIDELHKHRVPHFIGITGTNGKSTTTTLVDLMLKKAGFKSLLAGNIGNALTEEISNLKSQISNLEFIVAEVSSFQLESIKAFRPWISAILNITPDHLNRYKDMEQYINAKVRIFENQCEEDYLVLNADDQILKVKSEKLQVRKGRPKVLYFSREREVEGVYLRDGMIYCNLPEQPLAPGSLPLISQNEIRVRGVHNLENAMASSLVALLCGVPVDAIRDALKGFRGLEHRLEFVGKIDDISFINDSKGTNTGAVMKSLEGLERVILIMGGMDKGEDFSVLRDIVDKKVKALILLGEARDRIRKALAGVAETFMVGDLEEAVRVSLSLASAGDTVLLSPGCASFDMFNDFEDRGRRFKEVVKEIGKTL